VANNRKRALLGLCYHTKCFDFKYLLKSVFSVPPSETLEKHFINQFKLAALRVLQAKKSFTVYLYGEITLKERIN